MFNKNSLKQKKLKNKEALYSKNLNLKAIKWFNNFFNKLEEMKKKRRIKQDRILLGNREWKINKFIVLHRIKNMIISNKVIIIIMVKMRIKLLKKKMKIK
jgi:hypothetical protein